MIKIVVFDLGNVILAFDNRKTTGKLAEIAGVTEEEIRGETVAGGLAKEFDTGRITPGEFFSRLKERFRLSLTFEEFVPIWCDIFTLNPGIEELIERLRPNYRLCILSNTNSLHFEFIRKTYPVLGKFDDFFLSYQMGRLKPDPVVYKTVIDRSRVLPGEIFYTDDMAEYVRSAREHGIQAFSFESSGRLKADMERLGMLDGTAARS